MANLDIEKNFNFAGYPEKVLIELDSKINQKSKDDFIDLIELHARKIARYLDMDADIFVQAIREKDSKTISTYIQGLDSYFAEEIVFNFNSYTNNKLILGVTTGLMSKAIQKGYREAAQNPIVIQGILHTNDNRIVLGVRSKPSFRSHLKDEPCDHKIMFCPAGYATFNRNANLIHSFYKELSEELELTEKNIIKLKLVGQNKDTGFTEGIRLSIYAKTDISFQEVKEKWKNAEHGWEYADLIGIEFTKASISRLLTTKDFSAYSEKANGLVDLSIRPVLEFILITQLV